MEETAGDFIDTGGGKGADQNAETQKRFLTPISQLS